ncbi:inactive histone-lysine N-methyltransferase 2E isoform X1 [Ixodes scapularis]|uniref:inactive histone-lysine N-methyltransferase 2E isoform X1 n=1 Tax=Ixodes scapularis TaxID=6945 RepID=UPI001C389EA3|nr:inactive histone-lysine N-methyltransferase 2E isoform X1 [Ixodes scapularis]
MSLALPQSQAQPRLGGPTPNGGAPPHTSCLQPPSSLLPGVDARGPPTPLEVPGVVPQVVVVPPPPLRPREHKPHTSSLHHHGYANCFGLPYQDHNYGAPPPPTPPQSPPPAPQAPVHRVNGVLSSEDRGTPLEQAPPPTSLPNGCLEEVKREGASPAEESVTRCICGFNHDDEYMICCDHCSVWQHVDCMGLDRSRIPETYLCERCHPRRVDRHRARTLQTRKKQQMSRAPSRVESTSDESGGGAAGALPGDENRGGDHGGAPHPKGAHPRVRRKRRRSEGKEPAGRQLDPATGDTAATKRLKAKKIMKERIERKKVKLKNMVKKPKTRFLGLAQVPAKEEEAAQDAWGPGVSPPGGGASPGDRYETALINQYTPEVQLMAGSLKLNGQHEALTCKVSTAGGDAPWRVEACGGGQRRLVATHALGPQQPLLEVRGKFLSASQFRHQNPVFHKRLYPFVLFYQPCAEEETVCVDAREYGNEARFVRRSCCPNVQVQHVVHNGLLHLYLVSSRDIAPGQELTIPFDFDYRQCIHSVSCACGSEDCRVASKGRKAAPPAERKRRGRRVSTSSCGLVEEEPALAKEAARLAPHNDDQPSLGALAEPQECSPAMASPASDSATGQEGHQGVPEDQESEEQSSAERRRKMTREERKIDAIMRAFEKMERTEKRRRQALERMAQQHRGGPKHEHPPLPDKLEDERSNDSSLPAAPPEELKPEPHPEGGTEDRAVSLHRARKGKRRRSTVSRRRSRTVSGGSELLGSPPECEASLEAPPPSAMHCPLSPPCHREEEPVTAEVPATPPQGAALSPGPSPTGKAFALPKSKRFLMQGWLHEKACGDVAEGGPGHPGAAPPPTTPVEEAPCYVRCTRDPAPSAVGISAAHLRRNSCSTSAPTSGGSAKKRWLRQAMFESSEEVTEDGGLEGACPGSPPAAGEDSCQSVSPPPAGGGCCRDVPRWDEPWGPLRGGLDADLVTPLKKRRLVRESRESLDSMTGGLSPATGEAAATLLSFQAPCLAAPFAAPFHRVEVPPEQSPPGPPPEEEEDPPTPLDDEESLVDCDESTTEEAAVPEGPRLLPPIPVSLPDPLVMMASHQVPPLDTTAALPPPAATEVVFSHRMEEVPERPPEAARVATADAPWSGLRTDAVDVSDCSTASSSSSSLCALPPSSPGSRPLASSGGMLKRKVGMPPSLRAGTRPVMKVSLSEYRMRMRETGKAAGVASCKSPLGPPGPPVQDRQGTPLCSPAKGEEEDDPWGQPRRERLSQRLRREFGLDDDSDSERNPHADGAPTLPPSAAGYQPPLVPHLGTLQPPGTPRGTPGAAGGTTPPQGRPPQGYFHS